MKNKFLLILLTISSMTMISCEKIKGEGPIVTQERDITDFEGVALHIPAQIRYTPGNTYSVMIQAQQNILDEIKTTKESGQLLIQFNKENIRIASGTRISINITAPDLERLEVHGSGDIEVRESWEPFSANLFVNGSGDIRINRIATGELEARINGSGHITASQGAVASQFLYIAGSGDIEMQEVRSHATTADISGSGQMKVYAEQLLDVKISGSGRVRYRGNPVVTSNISGSGTVSRW